MFPPPLYCHPYIPSEVGAGIKAGGFCYGASRAIALLTSACTASRIAPRIAGSCTADVEGASWAALDEPNSVLGSDIEAIQLEHNQNTTRTGLTLTRTENHAVA